MRSSFVRVGLYVASRHPLKNGALRLDSFLSLLCFLCVYVYTCVQACMCARILRSAANFSYCFLSVIHLGLFVCLFVLVIVLRQGPLLAWDLSGRLACLANCGDSAQHHAQLFQCLVIICFIYFLVHSGGSKLGHRSCKTNT